MVMKKCLPNVKRASEGRFSSKSVDDWNEFVKEYTNSRNEVDMADGYGSEEDYAPFDITEIANISYELRQDRDRASAYGKLHALRRGADRQSQAQRAHFKEFGPYFLEMCFQSDKAAGRFRLTAYETKPEEGKTRRKKRKGAGRNTIQTIEATDVIRTGQARQIAKFGCGYSELIIKAEDGLLNLQEIGGKFPKSADLPKGTIGVANNLKGWIGVGVTLLHEDKGIVPDLRKRARNEEEGCAGRFETCIALFNDGQPGSGRNPTLTLGGAWVCDAKQSFLKYGRGIPLPQALYAGKEELSVQLLEAQLKRFANDEYQKIDLPEFGTHIYLKLSVKVIAADHKMFCTFLGKMGGSSNSRFHFIQPLKRGYVEDVAHFAPCGLKDMMRWRLEALTAVVVGCIVVLNDPLQNTTYYTIPRMCDELDDLKVPHPKTDRPTIAEILRKSKATDTWQNVWEAIEQGVIADGMLSSLYTYWRQETGSDAFPVFVSRNRSAFKVMLEMTEEILAEHCAHNTIQLDSTAADCAAGFLGLLFRIDHKCQEKKKPGKNGEPAVIHASTRSYMARSVEADLTAWLAGNLGEGSDAELDLDAIMCAIAFDHNRKARMAMFIALLVESGGLPIFTHSHGSAKWEALRLRMLEIARCRGFHDFCNGYHKDRMVSDVDKTYIDCHALVLMLARLLARSGLHTKTRPRSSADDNVRPEFRAETTVGGDGGVNVKHTPTCSNDAGEIALMHGVELSICLLFRIMSKKTDCNLNQYCASQRWFPFMASKMRHDGGDLCMHFFSDFYGEGLQKFPSRWFKAHGDFITPSGIFRCHRSQLQHWIERVRRHSKPEAGHSILDQNARMNTLILSYCVIKALLVRQHKRDAKSGVFVPVATVRRQARAADAEVEREESATSGQSGSSSSSSSSGSGGGGDRFSSDSSENGPASDASASPASTDRLEQAYQGSAKLRSVRVTADGRERDGKPIAQTLDEQVLQNLRCAIDDITAHLGAEYVYECGEGAGRCYIFGYGAIAVRLLEEVWKELEEDELADLKPWEDSEVPAGVYGLCVDQDEEPPIVMQITVAADHSVTARRLALGAVDSEQLVSFFIHVPEQAIWTKFISPDCEHKDTLQVLSAIKVDDCLPCKVCACKYAPCEDCPFCEAGDLLGMPLDFERDPLLREDESWTAERMPLAAETLCGIVSHIVSRDVAAANAAADLTLPPVPAASVLALAKQHLGDGWVKSFAPPETVLTALITGQLRKEANQRSGREDNIVKKLFKQWKGSGGAPTMPDGLTEAAPRYFRGQRVLAKYLNASQQLDANVGFEWFAVRVLGSGNLPHTYRVIYDVDQYEHLRTPPYIRRRNNVFKETLRMPTCEVTYNNEIV